MKDNPCATLSYVGSDGKVVYKQKKAFDTDVEAIEACKVMNKKYIDKLIHKLVPYKCPKCQKWHIGKNRAPLTEKKISKIKNS